MNIIDKFKLWYKYKSTGNIEEYKSYKQALELKNADINRYSRYLSDATQKFKDIQQRFSKDSKEYAYARDEMFRWRYTLDETILSLQYIRPNSQEDIEYRDKTVNNYADELKKVLSPNFDLRFHGTPIYFTEQILKSGCISSTADRYDGYIKSTDTTGEISVSDRESIDRTIQFFSDMSGYMRHLPGGCIFAILPNGNEDPSMREASLMPSVNFRENPEQLFGIFTTPENIEQVREWMSKYGFDADLIYTFEEFLEVVKEKSEEIDNQIQLKSNEKSKSIDLDEERKNHETHNIEGIVSTEGLAKIDKIVTAEERKQSIDAIKLAKSEMAKVNSNQITKKTEEREQN